MGKLPGDYVAGFVDGEGCFALKFRREIRHDRKNKPEYFYWDIEFAIVLSAKDRDILEQIKETLDCGRLGNTDKYGNIRYSVNDINDLKGKIVPFFDKYPLRAKKHLDFKLWKNAVEIFSRNQRIKLNIEAGKDGFQKTKWNEGDLRLLGSIREKMIPLKGGNRSQWKWL